LRGIYTLAIMSPDGRSVRQYYVGRWFLKLVYVLLLTVIVGALGGIAYGVFSRISHGTIEGKNTALKQKVQSLEIEQESLKEEMLEIRRMAHKVRSALGIEAKSAGILGQGGDNPDQNQTEVLEQDKPMSSAKAVATPKFAANVRTSSLTVQVAETKEVIAPAYVHVIKELRKLDETPSILPILTPVDGEGKVFWYPSGFGYRTHPTTKRREFHRGLDIATRKGTPVIAAAHGVVSKFGYDKLLGNMVKIKHPSTQMDTLYGHMSKFAAGMRLGKKVVRGETIGYVGSSGRSTGDNLHYGISKKNRWVNPMDSIIAFWSAL